jgi:hypothetical protein
MKQSPASSQKALLAVTWAEYYYFWRKCMSPKQITRLATFVGGASVIGAVVMVAVQPDWGVWRWWPAMGLALAMLLVITAILRGAYLTAQKRADLVDKLNDCYAGNSEQQQAP